MKKPISLVFVLLMVISLAACKTPTGGMNSGQSEASSATEPEIVTFADPLLESMVRDVIGKPEGDITIEEAEAVTELNLGIDWQQQPAEGSQIKDISGLEFFKNLETLEIHFHAITDISPLTGLTKLNSLSLGGNPVADITPLSSLTNLSWLTLFNCQAQDYTPLTNLTALGGLLLDHSTISDVSMISGLTELWWLSLSNTQVRDVSPLADLVNLKKLQLSGAPITDYSPLARIYPDLEETDFTLVTSLRELGFSPIDNAPQIESYKTEEMFIHVHHSEWGERGNEDEANAVILYKNHGTENEIAVIYYPESGGYLVFSHSKSIRYTYDSKNDNVNIEDGAESVDGFIAEVYDEPDPYPVLTPIKDFSKIMTDTFGVSADTLYNLPREEKVVDASSLSALGFTPDEDNACCIYVQREPRYFSIEVNDPKSGIWDGGGDVRFFTPLSDEFRIVVTYYIDEKKYAVGADDNDGGGAKYDLFAETGEHVDTWCSDNDISVEQYFVKAIDDLAVKDVYQHSVQLMKQSISDAFGLTIEELYVLPAE